MINTFNCFVRKPIINIDKPEKVFQILTDSFIDKIIEYPTIEEIENSNFLLLSKIKIGIYLYSINA